MTLKETYKALEYPKTQVPPRHGEVPAPHDKVANSAS